MYYLKSEKKKRTRARRDGTSDAAAANLEARDAFPQPDAAAAAAHAVPPPYATAAVRYRRRTRFRRLPHALSAAAAARAPRARFLRVSDFELWSPPSSLSSIVSVLRDSNTQQSGACACCRLRRTTAR